MENEPCTQQILDEILARYELLFEKDADAFLKIMTQLRQITRNVVLEKELN